MPEDNRATKHFKELSLTAYNSWYDNDVLKYLIHSASKAFPHLRYIFTYASKDSFLREFQQLILLSNDMKKPALFICIEPGQVHVSHFIVGIFYQEQLAIINPVGLTAHHDFYRVLQTLHMQGLVNQFYLSKTMIQRDPNGLMSCGPLCVELLRHFSQLPFQTLSSLFQNDDVQMKEGVKCGMIDISTLLPASLQPCLSLSDQAYQPYIEVLRSHHLQLLEVLTENEAEHALNVDEQTIMAKLVVERKDALVIQSDLAYLSLQRSTQADVNNNTFSYHESSATSLAAERIFPNSIGQKRFTPASFANNSAAQSVKRIKSEGQVIIGQHDSTTITSTSTQPTQKISHLSAQGDITITMLLTGGEIKAQDSVGVSHTDMEQSIRQCLIAYYKRPENQCIQRISGEALAIDSRYINLVIVRDNTKGINKERQAFNNNLSDYESAQINPAKQVALASLFQTQSIRSTYSKQMPKRVLILGKPGMGKTTLCKKIVYEFVENRLWHGQFEGLIWIPLRNLKRYLPKTLEEVFCEEFFRDQANRHLLAKQLLQQINQRPQAYLFLLDGWDEVAMDFNQSEIGPVLHDLLGQVHIIMTSRYHAAYHVGVDLQLEVVGFDSLAIEHYINTVFPTEQEIAKTLINFIKQNSFIKGLAHIPIQLDILCFSWDLLKAQGNHLIILSDLYEEMEHKFWLQYIKRPDVQTRLIADKKQERWLQSEPIRKKHLEELTQVERVYLQQLAFTNVYHNKIGFDYKCLEQAADMVEDTHNVPVDLNDIMQLDFLHTADKGPFVKRYFSFNHLTLQEYFAAQHIAQCIINKQAIIVYENSTNKYKYSLAEFVSYFLYQPHYQNVWHFVAGCLKPKPEALNDFFTLLLDVPEDLIGLRFITRLIQCLNETKLIDFPSQNNVISLIQQWIQTALPLGRQRMNTELINSLKLCQLVSHHQSIRNVFISALSNATYNKWDDRFNAILFIQDAEIKDKAIIEALKACLKDKDKFVRRVAIIALATLGYINTALIKKLVNMVTHGKAFDALQVLSHFSDSEHTTYIVSKLIPVLADSNLVGKIKLSVLDTIAILGKDCPVATDGLLSVLDRCDNWVFKLFIITALIQIDGTNPRVVEKIFQLYKEVPSLLSNLSLEYQSILKSFVLMMQQLYGSTKEDFDDFVEMFRARFTDVTIEDVRNFCATMQIEWNQLEKVRSTSISSENIKSYKIEKSPSLLGNSYQSNELIKEWLNNGTVEEKMIALNALEYVSNPDKKLLNLVLNILEESNLNPDLLHSTIHALRAFRQIDEKLFFLLIGFFEKEKIDFYFREMIERTLTSLIFNSKDIAYFINLICNELKQADYFKAQGLATVLSNLDLSPYLEKIIALSDLVIVSLNHVLKSTPFKSILAYTLINDCNQYYSVICLKALQTSTAIALQKDHVCVYEETSFYQIPIEEAKKEKIRWNFWQERRRIYENVVETYINSTENKNI